MNDETIKVIVEILDEVNREMMESLRIDLVELGQPYSGDNNEEYW